jgi:putative ribosome biogenesis GTPase RsgA
VAAPEVDDLWKLATSQREETEAITPNNVGNETFTLFVGQKQAGKSSLITAFHNPAKDDAPKQTVCKVMLMLSLYIQGLRYF